MNFGLTSIHWDCIEIIITYDGKNNYNLVITNILIFLLLGK